MDKKITFFVKNRGAHKQAAEPIAKEASERGFDVSFSKNPFEKTDIGIYLCKFSGYHPSANSELSVSLFHGFDSIYFTGPIRFEWSRFDIGLLPGEAGAKMWRKYSKDPVACPKIGAFNVGWPKSDILMSKSFQEETKSYQKNLKLNRDNTILYAPMNKADDRNIIELIDTIDTDTTNILIKHADFKSIDHSSIYEKVADNDAVRILNSEDNILSSLSISDIVVSDSESVLAEAVLTKTLPVQVTNWKYDDNYSSNEHIFDFVNLWELGELRNFIGKPKKSYNDKVSELKYYRDFHFSNFGSSSKVTVDLLESVIKNSSLPVEPLESVEADSQIELHKTRVKNNIQLAQSLAVVHLPSKIQKQILNKQSSARKFVDLIRLSNR